jgi:PAS domain S-box-containing protein
MYFLLYVDDEPGLLEICRLFLEKTGEFEVTCALSGSEALSLMQEKAFDAIISDYQMPGMDGIGLLKEVRASYGRIPFILFTGKGREEVVIAAINNGADFYLHKGGDPTAQFAELAHKVRQAVGRVHAEKALSDSQKRLTDIINFLPDATFAIDTAGTVIAWNRAMETMTGVGAAQVLGKGDHEYAVAFYGERRPMLIDLVFSPDGAFEKNHYTYARHTTTTITAETVLGKGGTPPVCLWGTASRLFDDEGTLVGAIESIRDITEMKMSEHELRAAHEQLVASEEELRQQYLDLEQSERKIRESEGRFRCLLGLFENAKKKEHDLFLAAVEGAGIMTGSPLGYLALVSDDESELAMFSWSEAAMAGCGMQDKPLVYKTEKTGLWGEAVRQRRAVITNDYAAPNPKKKGYPPGHPPILRHMNVPLMDEGRIVLVAGVANKQGDYTDHDVEELSLLMQGLWQVIKQKRAQAALEEEMAFSDAVLDSVPGLLYLYDEDGLLVRWNRNHEVATGYSHDELARMHLMDWYRGDERNSALIREGVQKAFEEGYADAEAELTIKDGTKVPYYLTAVRLDIGGRKYFTGMGIDISARRKAENAIQEANRKLNLLTSITRHDVANQMTIIQGFSHMAALNNPDPKTRDFLAKIDGAVSVIRRQVEFMRTYQDVGVKAPAWFRIDDLAQAARPAGLSVTSTCGTTEIFADPMIGRVFFNLFDNAVRHGKTVTKIAVSCEKSDGTLVITVEDNGTGVLPGEKEKIFEKGIGKNTGFGLFLVREILAITGISIRETGHHGKGARFEMSVPEGDYRSVAP